MVFGISSLEVPILFLLIFSLYILIGLKFSKKDIFAPWIVTPAIWWVMCVFIIFWGNLIFSLKGPFYIALIIWVTAIWFSSLFMYKLTSSTKKSDYIFNIRIFYFFLILSTILTPFYIFKAFSNLGDNFVNLFSAIRHNAGDFVNNIGILKYLKTLNPVLLIIAILQSKNLSRWIIYYLLFLNCLMGFVIMEKGTFFLIMVTVLYLLNLKQIITLKTIVISMGLFLVMSFAFNLLRHNDTNASFADFFAVYIISPCAAFETITPESSDYWGAATFPFFYNLSNIFFDSDFNIVSKVKEFVFVPIPTNVYTIMQPFYEDFGYLGIGIFGIITGVLAGFIYKRSNLESPIMIGAYIYILYSFILQFFQENIFVSLSVVIQFYFFMWIFYSKSVYRIFR